MTIISDNCITELSISIKGFVKSTIPSDVYMYDLSEANYNLWIMSEEQLASLV